MFNSMLSAFSQDLAIDLGTANTCVFARGRGIVVNEPSIVALNNSNGRVEAVGTEAKEMLGRTPGNITAIRPMRDGVIADFDAAEKMLTHFIRKAHSRSGWLRPRVIIGVPSEITQVERRAVKDSAMRAKASEVHLIEEAMAAAIGAGMPITEAAGNMVVDIGGGTTDIAVISLAGVVYGKSVRIAGQRTRRSDHPARAQGPQPPDRRADRRTDQDCDRIGVRARRAVDDGSEGPALSEGRPKTVTMDDEEIRKALAEPVRAIVQAVHDALERIPPELSADIFDRGIILTGGGSQLKNLDRRLRDETGLPVQMARGPADLGRARRRQDALRLPAAPPHLARLVSSRIWRIGESVSCFEDSPTDTPTRQLSDSPTLRR